MNQLRNFGLALTLLSLSAFAHEGAHGMKGTVTAISDNTITIKTTDDKTQVIPFDAKTAFVKGDIAATAKDLKVGDRVIIESQDMDGKMHAVKVRFGKPAKAAATATHSADHSAHDAKEKK